MSSKNGNGWEKSQQYVIAEIKRFSDGQSTLAEKQDKLADDLNLFKADLSS
jgi:hypothetical protein